MADCCHFENRLNHHDSAAVRRITVKFGMVTQNLVADKSFNFLKTFHHRAVDGRGITPFMWALSRRYFVGNWRWCFTGWEPFLCPARVS